jgi:hypothetical protein
MAADDAAPKQAPRTPVGFSYVLEWQAGEILTGRSRAVTVF